MKMVSLSKYFWVGPTVPLLLLLKTISLLHYSLQREIFKTKTIIFVRLGLFQIYENHSTEVDYIKQTQVETS